MDAIAFLKNLLIDSLAGISIRNLPFIALQLFSAGITGLLYLKLCGEKHNPLRLIAVTIGFTALFMIAFTSVPLSIVAGSIVLAFLLFKKNPKKAESGMVGEQKIVLLLISYAAGSGHLILLAMTLVVLVVFYFFYNRKRT